MRIAKVETMKADAGWRDFSFLKLTTDDGLVGWSEYNEDFGASNATTGLIARFAELIIGMDPREVGNIAVSLRAITRMSIGGVNHESIAAIENACKAKALGVPVYELFGGPFRTRINLYWSHCGSFRVWRKDFFEKELGLPPIATLDDVKRLGAEVKASGFKSLKTNPLALRPDDPVFMPGFRMMPNFLSRHPDQKILRIIHDEKIDLVVMGSHGRRNIERFFLGSTTEHILRKVPVPVLTVSRIIPSHEIHSPGPVPIRRIVYAVDLSESTAIGLQYSAELARTFGAELELVHVIDPLETGQWGTELPGPLPFDLSSVEQMARDGLQQFVDEAEIGDLKVNIFVVEGIPHNTIIRFADESGADLLIQNLKSKGVLERIMIGATAERVIRASHIPVLSIPVGTAGSFMPSSFTQKAVSYRE